MFHVFRFSSSAPCGRRQIRHHWLLTLPEADHLQQHDGETVHVRLGIHVCERDVPSLHRWLQVPTYNTNHSNREDAGNHISFRRIRLPYRRLGSKRCDHRPYDCQTVGRSRFSSRRAEKDRGVRQEHQGRCSMRRAVPS